MVYLAYGSHEFSCVRQFSNAKPSGVGQEQYCLKWKFFWSGWIANRSAFLVAAGVDRL